MDVSNHSPINSPRSTPPKKRKTQKDPAEPDRPPVFARKPVNPRIYLDVEAVEDNESSSDTGEDDDLGDFLDAEEEDAADVLPLLLSGGNTTDFALDADTQYRDIRERWRARSRLGRVSQATMLELPLRLRMPAVSDPHMWFIRVQVNHETEIVAALLQTAMEQASVGIASACAVPSIPGRVYYETNSPGEIMAFLPKHLIINSHPILVPLADRIAVLTLPKEQPIEQGSWMRVLRGKYQGDIACFEKMDEVDKDRLVTWVVPRISLEKGGKGKAAVSRLPANLFDADQAKAVFGAGVVKPGPEGAIRFRRWLFKDGLVALVKPRQYFDFTVTEPSASDLQRFLGARSWLKPQVARFLNQSWHSTTLSTVQHASIVHRNSQLRAGQWVVVVGEQLQGLRGTVKSTSGSLAVIKAAHENLSDSFELTVDLANLRPHFAVGDHIKVRSGAHRDQWGMVVAMEQSMSRLTFVDSESRMQVQVSIEDVDIFDPDFARVSSVTGVTASVQAPALTQEEEQALVRAYHERHPFLDKLVHLRHGPWKGYYGRMKATDNGLALVEFEAMQGRKVQVKLDDLELLTDEMLSKGIRNDTTREKTPEPDTNWSWLYMTQEELAAGSPFLATSPVASGNSINETTNHWLLAPAMQDAMKKYALSVQVKNSQAVKKGQFEGYIGSTMVNPRWKDSHSMEVRIGFGKEFIPVHCLHPISVTVKGTRAIVTEGQLCGRIVNVKRVAGDLSVATVGELNCDTDIVIPVIYLCKFY